MMGGAPRAIWALVPARGFDRAKTRLAARLSLTERSELARWMLLRTLGVLSSSRGLQGVVVLTDCDRVAEAAASVGAGRLRQRAQGRLGAIVDEGLKGVAHFGADAAIVLMADLPELETSDVERLMIQLNHSDVVLAPDELELGTNALAVRDPSRFTTQLGHEDSFMRHINYADVTGRRYFIMRTRGLAFDLDLPDQLPRLRVSRAALTD